MHSERKDAIDALSRAEDAAKKDDPKRAKSNAEAAVELLGEYERVWEAKRQKRLSRTAGGTDE